MAERERQLTWLKPAVFGAFDGVVTVLGVLFALASQPHALVLSDLGLAAAGAVSMGGGQWLSDSEHGFGASAVIGLATGLGTLLPVAPYLAWRGTAAAVVAGALCLSVAGGISWAKTRGESPLSWRRAVPSTFGLMLAASLATLLCAWATGAVG